MSHIHLPDGILSPIWWITGFLLTFAIIFYIIRSLKTENIRHKVPSAGVAAAIMLIGMSVPLFIVPVHLSLAVLTGILIGPKLGFLAVFVVNFILASIGHGGITLVGINTLIIGLEAVLGYYIFRAVTKRKGSYTLATMTATASAVIVSMFLMVSLVGATAGFSEALPHHHHGEHHHAEEIHYENDHHHEHDHSELAEKVMEIRYFAFTGWTAVILIFAAGILLESIGTTLIIRYFIKVRPTIVASLETTENM